MKRLIFTGSLLETLRQSKLRSLFRRISWIHQNTRRAYYGAIRLNPFISPRYLYLGSKGYLDLFDRQFIRFLPNFVVIGAQRSGTTSLHNYLAFHPEIFTSQPHKEPNLFLEDRPGRSDWKDYFEKRGRPYRDKDDLVRCYMAQGYMGQRLFGESSTRYTMGRFSRYYNIPKKMRDAVPGMKIIYLLRNPLERLVSHYLCGERVQYFGTIDAFVEKDAHALLNSLFWFQIKEYLRFFPKEQIKVVLFEDLVERPERTLDDLCSFLGVEEFAEYPPFTPHNVSPQRHLVRPSDLLFKRDTYERLIDPISKDIEDLSLFLERSLNCWDLSVERWCVPPVVMASTPNREVSRAVPTETNPLLRKGS